MKKIVIIAGATAVGKTDFSFEMAEKLNGEIICADSMQIYQGMDIGTAKPTKQEMAKFKHHLFDFVQPSSEYNVSDYNRSATAVIDELSARGVTPIFVGGTGLYIHSLLYKMDFNSAKPDMQYRQNMLAKPAEELCQLLEIKGITLTSSDRNNKRRLVRMLEILKSGKSLNTFRDTEKERTDYDVDLYILNRDRKQLYDRINHRVDIMLANGLVDEVKALLTSGLTGQEKAMQAIGYKEVVAYLNGDVNYDDMVEMLKKNSRRYAKRQITWFKKYDFANWINLE